MKTLLFFTNAYLLLVAVFGHRSKTIGTLMIEESLQENPTCQPGFGVSGDGINTAKTCTKCLKNTYSVGGVNAKCVACPSSRPYTYENFKTFTSIDSCHSNDNYHFCEAGKSGEHVITDTVPIRSSGQCTAYITNEADCKEAAKANNINIQHFEKRDDQYRPKGCYYNNGNRLTFNSRSSSTQNCQYWQRCLCKTEKHCKNCPRNTYSLGGHNSTCVACPSDKPTTMAGLADGRIIFKKIFFGDRPRFFPASIKFCD